MANDTKKVNLMQTAVNAAATLTAAVIGATGQDNALELLNEYKTSIYNDLLAIHSAEPAPAPRQYPSSGGSGGGGNMDPGTLVIKQGKHAGKTIAEVYGFAPDYINWLATTSRNEFLKKRAQAYLDQMKGTPAEAPAQAEGAGYF